MRATLTDPALTGRAGQFVWLELDFDRPANQAFLARHRVAYTPSLFVLDPKDERVTAMHLGGMTLGELNRLLDEGQRGFARPPATPADRALARGDDLLGHGRLHEAASAYREAVTAAPHRWPERERAVSALAWSLWVDRQDRACAELACAEAPGLAGGQNFGRVVLAGLGSANRGGTAPWAVAARRALEPMAMRAVSEPGLLRDHRFQLYQQLMSGADARGDRATLESLGHRWLDELDHTVPADDDERSALDIARVDAASEIDEPARVLPALEAAERAMPANTNASLRLAQMAEAAGRHDQAIAACRRGLAHASGPLQRAWLLEVEAGAWTGRHDPQAARRALEQARDAARQIGSPANRNRNLAQIARSLEALGRPPG